MTRFTPDNTDGYDKSALSELNKRFYDRVALHSAGMAELDDNARKSFLDHLAEDVLAEYDAAHPENLQEKNQEKK